MSHTPPKDEQPDIVDDEVESSRAPLLDHLNELRSRLIWALVALSVATIGCFFIALDIYELLLEPFARMAQEIRGTKLDFIYTAPMEFFFAKLKLALFGGLFVAFPFLAYQVYAFVAPGLYKNERGAFAPFLIGAPALFVGGMSFVYYFVLPFVMRFALSQEQLGGENSVSIQLLTRVSDYLNLVTTLILAFGLSFQLPVLLMLLGGAGIVSSKQLIKFWKFALVGIFAFAALATPPDPISQLILGSVLMGLYGISIAGVRLVEKRGDTAGADA